jgi:cysteine desulfurase
MSVLASGWSARRRMRRGGGSYIGVALQLAIGRKARISRVHNRLYLDHAATTPVLPEARSAMADALERWANPSSPHAEGRAAKAELEAARERIKDVLGWRHDVILTSGATEAIAIAARRARVAGRALGATEHEAVGTAMGDEAQLLPVDDRGLVDFDALDRSIAQGPTLVAIQHVNNETGVVQPIDEIGARVGASGSLLLADCAQSAGKLPLPVADLIALSGHKFGGPPGTGALLVKDMAMLEPSGGQERGYRRGTENLPGAAAMAAALHSRAFAGALDRAVELRGRLEREILAAGGTIIAAEVQRSPFIGAYALPGTASSSQLVQLDLAGVAVSAGSACSSGSMKASRVLAAMGMPATISGSVIRVSFGPDTGEADVDRFLGEWRRIAARARAA